jgi:hypothetical protein
MALSPLARASERSFTLEAIHQLENPMNSTRPGPCGELGPYQFGERTWRQHTQAPFYQALDRGTSEVVAVRHYEWIKSELTRCGVAASPYNIALAWNGGVGAVTRGHAPAVARDYARRAANLVESFERATMADAGTRSPFVQERDLLGAFGRPAGGLLLNGGIEMPGRP